MAVVGVNGGGGSSGGGMFEKLLQLTRLMRVISANDIYESVVRVVSPRVSFVG